MITTAVFIREESSMLRRLRILVRGFMGLFISGLEKANPRALIEAEKENLRVQISRFNENLAQHASFVERLMRQIKNQEKDEQDLAAKTAAMLKLGHRGPAGQAALRLKTLRAQLEENRQQLVAAEQTYQKLIKARDVSVRDATEKIDKLKRMISEAEMLEAQAELQEMAQGMIGTLGAGGDTLSRVEEYLTERRDLAAGRARVASSSIDSSEVEMLEAEQEALGEMALAEFASAYGLDVPAEASAADSGESAPAAQPTPLREMGPGSGS